MITSFETEAYYKQGKVNEIDSHIQFLEGQMDFVYSLKIGKDSDNNIVAISSKIAWLKRKKSILIVKIKELRS